MNAVLPSLLVLPTLPCRHLAPRFRPAVVTYRRAQGQHRVDIPPFPPHARPLQACLHHDFMPTLHAPRPNWPARCLIDGILHLPRPLL
jgi:hypothetical protein